MQLDADEQRILGRLGIDLGRVEAWINGACRCGDGQARLDYLLAWLGKIKARGRINSVAERRHLETIMAAGERLDAARRNGDVLKWAWWVHELFLPEVITYVSFDRSD